MTDDNPMRTMKMLKMDPTQYKRGGAGAGPDRKDRERRRERAAREDGDRRDDRRDNRRRDDRDRNDNDNTDEGSKMDSKDHPDEYGYYPEDDYKGKKGGKDY